MKTLLLLLLLILSFPVGLLLAHLARDELVQGRRWFTTLFFLSLCAGIVLFFTLNLSAAITCFFIAIVAGVAVVKSKSVHRTKPQKKK